MPHSEMVTRVTGPTLLAAMYVISLCLVTYFPRLRNDEKVRCGTAATHTEILARGGARGAVRGRGGPW